jgi:prophage regulatory protein
MRPAELFPQKIDRHSSPTSNKMRASTMASEGAYTRPTLIRLKQVLARTGMSRSTVYSYISVGRFPAPVPISTRCVAWIEDEVDHWISDRIAAHRNA